jgi:hypothetical protein
MTIDGTPKIMLLAHTYGDIPTDIWIGLIIAFFLLLVSILFAWIVSFHKPKRLPRTVAELRAEVLERHDKLGEDICSQILERRRAGNAMMFDSTGKLTYAPARSYSVGDDIKWKSDYAWGNTKSGDDFLWGKIIAIKDDVLWVTGYERGALIHKSQIVE